MDSCSLSGDCLSPESTVTSLLSSSGHLRSALMGPEPNATFTYRDKVYESASAALDAYITDFERSGRGSGSVTGRLLLPHGPGDTLTSSSGASTPRNKDVLRESLTDVELDFLSLPVSSLHHPSNRDRLSMTTNELLAIPCDGSMPVTHTSALLQGFLSQSEASRSPRATHTSWGRPSSVRHHPARGRPAAAMLKPDVDISSGRCCRSEHRAERTGQSVSLLAPRRLAHHQPTVGCSGASRAPDNQCPAWVHRCDLSELESDLWDPHDDRRKAPSWVAELQDNGDRTPSQVDSQQTLRDLRLQFAEQIAILAAEKKKGPDIMATLFRDNRIESLIQKADRVLNSLSQSYGGLDNGTNPAGPTDCAEAEVHSLKMEEHPVPPHSEAAAGGHTETMTDGGTQVGSGGPPVEEVLRQPGPVEALKQMLFRLQAVEAELQRRQPAASLTPTDTPRTEEGPAGQRPENEAELDSCSGGPSLQRALHHLSRLKVLVEEPREKRTEEEEERDEDEGRYSSSSVDGLVGTQGRPS